MNQPTLYDDGGILCDQEGLLVRRYYPWQQAHPLPLDQGDPPPSNPDPQMEALGLRRPPALVEPRPDPANQERCARIRHRSLDPPDHHTR
jgi:hypothetical protein